MRNWSIEDFNTFLNTQYIKPRYQKHILKIIILKRYKSLPILKFIIKLQKNKRFTKLVNKYLLETYPIFEKSGLYPAEPIYTFTDRGIYEYGDIIVSLQKGIYDNTYFNFVKTFHTVFHYLEVGAIKEEEYTNVQACGDHKNGGIIGVSKHDLNEIIEKLIKDILLIDKEISKKKISKNLYRIIIHNEIEDDMYMLLLRTKFFMDMIKFRIFYHFGEKYFDLKLAKKMIKYEKRWENWRKSGYPNLGNVVKEKQLKIINDDIKIKKTVHEKYELLDCEFPMDEPIPEDVPEWHKKRIDMFK
ncbi:hypothetical protein TCON_2183 [Astathelohania contejeani]|uniref:Uncharacterized protein n=1 Tax=Astathelohania contejeani TaxID=164912 RepID=A0ABQ7HWU5_9MICR|nr:hypothetical protein TCON_2183 [Thelohania contejeani]